jgi:hypothetical protein
MSKIEILIFCLVAIYAIIVSIYLLFHKLEVHELEKEVKRSDSRCDKIERKLFCALLATEKHPTRYFSTYGNDGSFSVYAEYVIADKNREVSTYTALVKCFDCKDAEYNRIATEELLEKLNEKL